jgi:S1-C subfamily serine protease
MKKLYSLRYKLMLLVLIGIIGIGAVAALPGLEQSVSANTSIINQTSQPTVALPSIIAKNETLAAIETTLAEIYAQVNPSVVNIQVTQKAEMPDFPQIPNFPFFFEQPQGRPDQQQPQEPQEFYRRGAGSGFVWDKEGHIITNNHVVEDADKITVTFADNTIVPAEVIGTDPDSDLAVLKVDLPADRLQPVELGDSNQVKVGHVAVAIGNPFGLENTMTVGYISTLGRVLPSSSGQGQGPTFTIPDIIQTDASINPGNSGGVLVNDQGQVIGVTAAIESPVRASAGVGFAIPSAIVKKVVPALIEDGYFEHPWLGLSGMSLTPDLAKAMNLKEDQRGALVIDVTPDSPADKAGLQGSDRQVEIEDQQMRVGGDVIIAFNSQPVQGFDDLVAYLAQSGEVGQKDKLTVLRDGKEETVEVTLAARPKPAAEPELTQEILANGPKLGIEGITVTPEIAEAMGLSGDQQGVLIERIQIGSPADQAGLNGSYKAATMIAGRLVSVGGDIITAIDDKPVTSVEDLQTIIRQAEPGQTMTLTVLRDGKQVEVPVTFSN